jgi:hypothetical protein
MHARKECERRDSNPHGLPHRILSPARLPVPPLSRGVFHGTIAAPLIQHSPVRWLCVAIVAAAVVHAVDLYQFESFEFDKVNHVEATASWLAGRGFTIPDVAPGGLPQTVYRPLLGFPPGYAFALAPFMRVTGSIWWSTYALDVAAQLLFLAAWTIALYAVTTSPAVVAGLLVLWTIVFSPIAAATYMDLLALALFAGAIAAGVRSVGATGRERAVAVALGACFIAGACVTRYAYWPLAAVVPLATVAAAPRDRRAWTGAAVHLLVAGAAIVATALFMQRATGEAVFLSRLYPEQTRSWNWPHLLALNPFAADALGAGRVYALIAKDHGPLESTTTVVLWSASLASLGLAAAYVASRVRDWSRAQSPATETFFTAAGVLTCGATLAMNVWLTLRLPAGADGWTVGGEPRYYAPMLPFLGIWVWLAARDRSLGMPRVRALAAAMIAAIVVVSVPVRAVRVYRYVTKNAETAWLSRGRRDQAAVILAAIRRIDTGTAPPLVVDDSPKWRRYVATMGGALVVTHADVDACAGRDAREARFLDAVPAGTALPRHAARVGRVEDVDLLLVTGAVCAPRPRR